MTGNNDLCGIVEYTNALTEQLAQHFELTVIPLRLELLEKETSPATQAYVERLSNELQTFDCVNVQFEPSLFGSSTKSIRTHFFALIKKCAHLILTLHNGFSEIEPCLSIPKLLYGFIKGDFRQRLLNCNLSFRKNSLIMLYHDMIRFCKHKNYPIIVHNQKDRAWIEVEFDYAYVYDHPLSYFDQQYIESLKKTFSRETFCQKFSLDTRKSYIGLSGFISSHRGHETAIRALEYLPENFELCIFGSQHPNTIKFKEPIDRNLEALIELIKSKNLVNRVKFCGALNHEDFVKVLLTCDINILPYQEIYQPASGVAALILETCSRAIVSNCHVFSELAKYAPNSFRRFSIGNYLELATAILSHSHEEYLPYLRMYNQKYNVHTSIALYKRLSVKQIQEPALYPCEA